MKKKTAYLIFTIALFLIFSIFPTAVYASSFALTMSAPSTISSNQEFSVNVGVSNSSNLSGVSFRLNFDDSKLELLGSSVQNSFGSIPDHPNYGVIINPSRSGSFSLYTFRFKARSAFSVSTSTDISISNVTGSVDQNGIATGVNGTAPSAKTISIPTPKSTNNNLSALTIGGSSVPNFSAGTTTYNLGRTDRTSVSVGATAVDSKARVTGTGNVNLAYGANAIEVVVTAESGATKTYTINISRNDPRSSNNFLESITMSAGSIQFDKNRDSYTVIVDYDVEEFTITATKEDASASIRNASITKQLEVYSNKFEFVVVAENNSQRTYSVNVVRRDEDGYAGSLNTNSNLASLDIEGYEIDFDKETLEYKLQVGHTVKELIIASSVEDNKATLVAPESYALSLGENVFEFVVIAEDETQKTYTLTVFRETNLAPLEIDQLIERLDEVEANILNVISRRNQSFDIAQLNQLKAANKPVAFHIMNQDNQSIGYWLIESSDLESVNNFNHGVSLLSRIPDSINTALNYASAMVVSFDHEGDFDSPKTFVLNLNNTFDASYPLNVYYFNEETSKLQLIHSGLEQQDNTLSWQMNHASIYVITPATLSSGFDLGFDLPFEINLSIILGILIALVLSLFSNLLLLLKIKKLQKHMLKRKHESIVLSDKEFETTTNQEIESVENENDEDKKESN